MILLGWLIRLMVGWYTVRQRRQLKQQKYTSTEAGLKNRKVNREVRKKMKVAKEEWIEEQ